MIHVDAVAFDYGRTLVVEPDLNLARGAEAVLKTVGGDAEPMRAEYVRIRDCLIRKTFGQGIIDYDPSEKWLIESTLYCFGIETEIPLDLLERKFFMGVSKAERTPGSYDMLKHIQNAGVRIGVISNHTMSELCLRDRLERLFPEIRFDCVLTSSSFKQGKPSIEIFQHACSILEASLKNTMFCGDSIQDDVEGSQHLGMVSVWYSAFAKDKDRLTEKTSRTIEISEWKQLAERLKPLKSGGLIVDLSV